MSVQSHRTEFPINLGSLLHEGKSFFARDRRPDRRVWRAAGANEKTGFADKRPDEFARVLDSQSGSWPYEEA